MLSFFSGVRGADLFLTVLFCAIFSTSSLVGCVKINLGDEAYVSGPKSYCTIGLAFSRNKTHGYIWCSSIWGSSSQHIVTIALK